MLARPASHAGSWYSADASRLAAQISAFFNATPPHLPVRGARILIGPHAGYTYCGARLAETYASWDTKGVRRVFLLGPSHHVYFRDAAKVSKYAYYTTPGGRIPVDTAVCEALVSGSSLFEYMSSSVDDDEHLFEMHVPFLHHRAAADGVDVKIVPIMISGMSRRLRSDIVAALLPYMRLPENTFVISLDFCHWGRRFGYTTYAPGGDVTDLCDYDDYARKGTPIYKSIEALDRAAMDVASAGLVSDWDGYIEATGNTICGQKPIAIVLALVDALRRAKGALDDSVFEWIGYSQSSQAVRGSDLSVSYASGYVKLEA